MTSKQFKKMPDTTQSLWTFDNEDIVEVEFVSKNIDQSNITFIYNGDTYTKNARYIYITADDAFHMIDDDSWNRIFRYMVIYPLKRWLNKFKRQL